MKEIQVDDLQQNGEFLLHYDARDEKLLEVNVIDLRLGDRDRVVLGLVDKPTLTMTMKQKYINSGDMKLYRISKDEDPEYFL